MSDNKFEMNSKSPLVNKGYRKMYTSQDDDPSESDIKVEQKLARRQTLSGRKRRVNDAVTALALLGLVLVVITTELNLDDVITRGGIVQLTLLATITFTTIILEILLLWYLYSVIFYLFIVLFQYIIKRNYCGK